MQLPFKHFVKRLSLAQRFMLASLIILVGGMIGLGEWVGRQIESGVIHRTAATTALFVDSFIAPNLQELGQADTLTPADMASLTRLLQETPLGQQIVAFKVWDAQGRLLYSTQSETIGQIFPIREELALAWQGQVVSHISELTNAENLLERQQQSQLLETYSPVRLGGTNQIIAVAEFYQTVNDLQKEITAAQRRSWLVVGLAMLVMYLLLAGFVQRASNTIARQQNELSRQVDQLTELLKQNEALHERVRRAAARTTALNERFLRRVSAELHDGPAQELGLALLRLDQVVDRFTTYHLTNPKSRPVSRHIQKFQMPDREASEPPVLPKIPEVTVVAEDLNLIQGALQRALQEIRALSAGLGVPQLNQLTVPETLARVVRVHEQRTKSKVSLTLDNVPEQASLPLKITLYRLIQEALNNAYRHAGGAGQKVKLGYKEGQFDIEISDQGSGFNPQQAAGDENHLGLMGMRERVESLGGCFRLESSPGQGTKIVVNLSLQGGEDQHE